MTFPLFLCSSQSLPTHAVLELDTPLIHPQSLNPKPPQMSGKFRVYVMNRDAQIQKISLLKCNPIITIVIYQGVWKQFQMKKPEGWEESLADRWVMWRRNNPALQRKLYEPTPEKTI